MRRVGAPRPVCRRGAVRRAASMHGRAITRDGGAARRVIREMVLSRTFASCHITVRRMRTSQSPRLSSLWTSRSTHRPAPRLSTCCLPLHRTERVSYRAATNTIRWSAAFPWFWRRCETYTLIMAALRNGAGHYIFALWQILLLSYFFPPLFPAVAGWMSTILLHMVWPYSANLECLSET